MSAVKADGASEAEGLVAAAQGLIPMLQQQAEAIAAARTVPTEVIAELRAAGLMDVLRPRRYGGPEHGFDLVHRIASELGRGDGSTAWVYVVLTAHDVFLPLFPRSVQDEFWNSELPSGASSYAPTGKVAPADGGFTLSGKWSFCSGVDHAGWLLLGGIVGMLDNPKRPDIRYFMLPIRQVQIIDDWHVVGLRGTGSKSVSLNDVFVPNERVISFAQIVAGQSAEGPAPDGYSESLWVHIGFSFAGPAVGIGKAAYDATVGDLRRRYERRDPVFEARRPAVQMHLAEASALIDSAELLLNRSFDASFARVRARTRLTNEERARNRRDSCIAIRSSLRACEILMSMTGAHGLSNTHPVQRALRDLYAISAHPAASWDSPALSFGSVALGGPVTEMMV